MIPQKKVANEQHHNYIYVCISTQNQLINCIPLMMALPNNIKLDSAERYCLSLDAKGDAQSKFSNAEWNENLKSVVNEIEILDLSRNAIVDIGLMQKKLNEFIATKIQNRAIFWNVTGGQRPFVLAIQNIVCKDPQRINDIIAYAEGNTNQLVLLKPESQCLRNIDKALSIELNFGQNTDVLEKVLNLSSFKIKEKLEMPASKESMYIKIFDLYIKDKNFRDALRKGNNENERENEYNKLEAMLRGFKATVTEVTKKNTNQLLDFGGIFERMVFAKIKEQYASDILDIQGGVKITWKKAAINTPGELVIDELDIVIVTKAGQIKNIECKTGLIKKSELSQGDELKSHHYTTWAISGVYGAPIFVTPCLKSEITDTGKTIDKYKQSIGSADQAKLDILYVNEIGTPKCKKLLTE